MVNEDKYINYREIPTQEEVDKAYEDYLDAKEISDQNASNEQDSKTAYQEARNKAKESKEATDNAKSEYSRLKTEKGEDDPETQAAKQAWKDAKSISDADANAELEAKNAHDDAVEKLTESLKETNRLKGIWKDLKKRREEGDKKPGEDDPHEPPKKRKRRIKRPTDVFNIPSVMVGQWGVLYISQYPISNAIARSNTPGMLDADTTLDVFKRYKNGLPSTDKGAMRWIPLGLFTEDGVEHEFEEETEDIESWQIGRVRTIVKSRKASFKFAGLQSNKTMLETFYGLEHGISPRKNKDDYDVYEFDVASNVTRPKIATLLEIYDGNRRWRFYCQMSQIGEVESPKFTSGDAVEWGITINTLAYNDKLMNLQLTDDEAGEIAIGDEEIEQSIFAH